MEAEMESKDTKTAQDEGSVLKRLIMHQLLDLMYDGNPVELSDKGKVEVDEGNEHYDNPLSKQIWELHSVNVDCTVKMCCIDVHHFFNTVPFDWLVIKEA